MTVDMPPLAPGTHVRGYRIERLAGRGSFAEVYRATRLADGKRVALKRLRDSGIESRVLDRLRRMPAESALAIPLEVFRHDDQTWLVEEWADGGTLEDRLRSEQALPEREVAQLGWELAQVLDDLHHAGLVHRDVKPSNVLIVRGRYKLSDFGVSTSIDPDTGRTRRREVVGTPRYMPPEQATGNPVSPASDVFSLGLVLYRAAYGRLPDERSEDLGAQLRARATQPIVVPPSRFQELIQRCLTPDPELRPTTWDLEQGLRPLATHHPLASGVDLVLDEDDADVPWPDEDVLGHADVRPPQRPGLPGAGPRPPGGLARDDQPADPGAGPGQAVPHAAWTPGAVLPPSGAPTGGVLSTAPAGGPPIAPRPESDRPPPSWPGLLVTPHQGVVVVAAALGGGGVVAVGGWWWLVRLVGGGVLVAAGLSLARLVRTRLASRAPAIERRASDVLFGAASRTDLTMSLKIEVDEVMRSLRTVDSRILGVTLRAMVDEYDGAQQSSDRQAALVNVVTIMEKLQAHLSPWHVRHKEAIATTVAVVGCVSGAASVITGFLG